MNNLRRPLNIGKYIGSTDESLLHGQGTSNGNTFRFNTENWHKFPEVGELGVFQTLIIGFQVAELARMFNTFLNL